jgi:flagellar M-ring protein FliF
MSAMRDRLRELFVRTNPLQRVAIGAALVALVAGAVLLLGGGSKVSMSPLFTDLTEGDAASVVSNLESQGISYEIKDAGKTIYVPSDIVYKTRLDLSAAGLPVANDGYALLDKQGITTSEFKQRTTYQRALEGELESTIGAIDAIDRARVQIALPNSSAFIDDPGSPTASVLVKTKNGSVLDEGQVQAIAYLVSSSLRNMKPEDVSITDTAGNILRAPGMAGFASGGSGSKQQMQFEQNLGMSLTQLIGRTAGLDKVSVKVSAVINMDQRSQVSERYTKPEGTEAETDTGLINAENPSSETYEGVNPNNNSVLGPDGAPVSTVANNATTNYEKNTGDRTYLYDKVVEQVQAAPGAVSKLSIAVAVDDKAVSQEQVANIESLVRAAAGIDQARGDQVVVSRIPFVDTSAEITEAEQAAEDAASSAQMMALIRSAMIMIGLIVASFFAYRSVRKARTVVVESIDVTGLGGGSSENVQSLTTVVNVHDEEDEDLDKDALEALRDENQEELSKMADMQPEAVAQVLRTWLSDPRR